MYFVVTKEILKRKVICIKRYDLWTKLLILSIFYLEATVIQSLSDKELLYFPTVWKLILTPWYILDWINRTDIFPEKKKQNAQHPPSDESTEVMFINSLPVSLSHGRVPALISISLLFSSQTTYALQSLMSPRYDKCLG